MSQANKQEWHKTKKDQFELWIRKYEQRKKKYSNRSYHNSGNKAGELLAHLVKGPNNKAHIPGVID